MGDQTHGAIEQHLRALGGRDDLFPTTPDITAEMRGVIGDSDARPRRFAWRHVAIVMLLVLAALTTALAVPASRTAIADFFGIEGIRIEFGRDEDGDMPGTPVSIGGSLLLGERTSPGEAMDAAPFDVVVPTDAQAGEPDEVYLNDRSGVTVIGMIWHATGALPEIGATGVGMLLLEIESDEDDAIFVKNMVGGTFAMATVNDRSGYWIEGGMLAVEPVEGLMLDLLEPQMRRSGNVLIWSDGDITYRLETSLPMVDAVRMAESLAPVEGQGNP